MKWKRIGRWGRGRDMPASWEGGHMFLPESAGGRQQEHPWRAPDAGNFPNQLHKIWIIALEPEIKDCLILSRIPTVHAAHGMATLMWTVPTLPSTKTVLFKVRLHQEDWGLDDQAWLGWQMTEELLRIYGLTCMVALFHIILKIRR